VFYIFEADDHIECLSKTRTLIQIAYVLNIKLSQWGFANDRALLGNPLISLVPTETEGSISPARSSDRVRPASTTHIQKPLGTIRDNWE